MGKQKKGKKAEDLLPEIEANREQANPEPPKKPKHAGPSILELLWAEMDRLMEGLMTGADAEDGGDKFRAEELAFCLAVFTNPYEPNIDSIREETVRRWEESSAEK